MIELTDEEKERIAIAVEHYDPAEADAEYERRCEAMREWKARRVGKKKKCGVVKIIVDKV